MKTADSRKTQSYLIIFILIIGSAFFNPVSANSNTFARKDSVTQKLPVESMRADLVVLWSAIKEMHPGYGYYTSKDSLKLSYEQTYSSIKKPLYESEYIAHIYPFICKLRCGHTQIKHSSSYKDIPGLYPARLPFKVLVHNDRVFITSRQTDRLQTGDEIMSINNVPAREIIKHGFDLYSTDGYNKTFKELFLSEYDGFEDACNKFYHWKGIYKMQVKSKTGKISEVMIDTGKNTKEFDGTDFNNYKDWKDAEIPGNLKLYFDNNGSTALFETKPFSYQDTITYKNVFHQVHAKNIKNLILDMRHNSGGDIRVAIQLLSYLADAPFDIIKDVKSRLPDPALNKSAVYFDQERMNGFRQGYTITNKEGMWYHVETTAAMGTIYGPLALAKEDHFNGNLYVLIDGATFSSGALFTAALKSGRKNVKFIGRETAGSEEGCNGMVMQELTLPNTKISIDFPWMRVESVAKKPSRGRGIMPDYEVIYEPEDIVIKKDRDLEEAVKQIRSQFN